MPIARGHLSTLEIYMIPVIQHPRGPSVTIFLCKLPSTEYRLNSITVISSTDESTHVLIPRQYPSLFSTPFALQSRVESREILQKRRFQVLPSSSINCGKVSRSAQSQNHPPKQTWDTPTSAILSTLVQRHPTIPRLL